MTNVYLEVFTGFIIFIYYYDIFLIVVFKGRNLVNKKILTKHDLENSHFHFYTFYRYKLLLVIVSGVNVLFAYEFYVLVFLAND